MKRFVKYTVFFAVMMLATLLAAELAMRRIPDIYTYKDGWMRRHKGEVETLVLGNSTTLEGVDPSLLPGRAFNLAISAQTLEQDAYLLEHYTPYPALKVVILPIAENIISPQLEDIPSFRMRAAYYCIHMGYGKHGIFSRYNYEIANLNVCREKVKAYRDLRRRGLSVACDSLGFAPEMLADKQAGWARRGFATFTNKLNQDSAINVNERYLARIVRFCQTNEVQLVLVTPPQWLEEMPPRDELYRKIDAVGNRLARQPGVTYRNYLRDPRFVADDFFDAAHLNDAGACKFTRIIVGELIGRSLKP